MTLSGLSSLEMGRIRAASLISAIANGDGRTSGGTGQRPAHWMVLVSSAQHSTEAHLGFSLQVEQLLS